MKHDRLHALTDGIFAIVMTLLVLELRVPVIEHASNKQLLDVLVKDKAVFVSYPISFTLLFIYWRAHNFIISTMAKNLDVNIVNLNMLFLLLVGIVPFTTHFMGSYSNTQVGITIYALNIVFIGLNLAAMRAYVDKSPNIESEERTAEQRQTAYIRLFTPIVCSALAIPASFFSTSLALGILLFAVVFNLFNNAADMIRKVFRV